MVLLRTPQGEFAFGYGTTELGGTIPPRADTHFRAASNTKTMTAAVIVLLVQEGKLRFDDTVSKYVQGVPSLDDLRRELIGIKRLAADVDGELLVWAAGSAPAELTAMPRPPLLPVPVPDRDLPGAERRHLTVMFGNLADSTRLSATSLQPPPPSSPTRGLLGVRQHCASRAARKLASSLCCGPESSDTVLDLTSIPVQATHQLTPSIASAS